MPMVGKKKYPYTTAGKAAAKKAARGMGAGVRKAATKTGKKGAAKKALDNRGLKRAAKAAIGGGVLGIAAGKTAKATARKGKRANPLSSVKGAGRLRKRVMSERADKTDWRKRTNAKKRAKAGKGS